MEDLISRLTAGDRVIITALGTEAYADAVFRAGAYPVFCDVNPAGTDADIPHLMELAANGAAGFICAYDGEGAEYARGCGIPTVICRAAEFTRPAYRTKTCRHMPNPHEQYPYYMLVLSNAEDICRENA